MGRHVSYLDTKIKIFTKSSNKSPLLVILQVNDLFKFEVGKFVYCFLTPFYTKYLTNMHFTQVGGKNAPLSIT